MRGKARRAERSAQEKARRDGRARSSAPLRPLSLAGLEPPCGRLARRPSSAEIAIPFSDRTRRAAGHAGGLSDLSAASTCTMPISALVSGARRLFGHHGRPAGARTAPRGAPDSERCGRRSRRLRGADDLATLLMGSERQLLVSWQGRDGEPRFEGDPTDRRRRRPGPARAGFRHLAACRPTPRRWMRRSSG